MELTDSQKLVVNTKNKSILVSASAGSGKTFVVVKRIIDSIKNGQDVSKLLVLTFTNAAASELKERIIKGLNELREEYYSKNDIENVKRISRQISKVPLSDISTIHSFCLNIIRNNFFVLGIDPLVTTLEESKRKIMLNEIILDVLDEEYEKEDPVFIDILDLQRNEENLIDTINSLYNMYKKITYNDEWLKKCEDSYALKEEMDLSDTFFGKVIINSIHERFDLLKLEVENLLEKLNGVSEFESRREVIKEIETKLNTALKKTSFDELYNYIDELLNISNMPRTKVSDEALKDEVVNIKKDVTTEIKQIKKVLYKNSQGILEELSNSKKYLDWYINVIRRIDNKFMNQKIEKAVIDFSDYEHLALKALEDEDIVKKYKEKYDEIYIDEYQDTSYLQEEIIKKISKDNVIMVGDVKQSIYGFRNAKPELFSSKYSDLEEIKDDKFKEKKGKIILSKNYRSRWEVIDSINDIFTPLMNISFGGAPYEDKEKLVFGAGYEENNKNNYTTELNVIENLSELEDEDETKEKVENIVNEANLVSNRINELIQTGFEVYDLKEKKYRKCSYKDIVILLRTAESKANIIRDILLNKGIPAITDSKEGMYESDEINLVVSFLKVLDNPYDDISLVSVMYSIIGKFTLDELVEISLKRKNNYIIDILKNNKDEFEENLKIKINSFLNLLDRFKIYLNTYKLSDVVQKLYNETGLYISLNVEDMGSIKCANLDGFLEVISDFEKNEEISTLYMLLKYIKELKSKQGSSDSPKIIGENEDAVRIMTIHKSKGLEFPVVFLMLTDKKYNENDIKDKMALDDTLGIGLDIYNKKLNITYPSVIKQAIKEKKKRVLRSEALRLLYVALTRAKEKLIITGSVNNFDKLINKLDYNKQKISPTIAYTFNNFLSIVLTSYIINNDNIKLNVICNSETDISDSERSLGIERSKDRLSCFKEKIKNLKPNIKRVSEIRNLFNVDKYKSRVDKKYTVTELKEQIKELNLNDLKPQTISSKINSTSYGTYIHSVIEHLDYTNINYDSVYKTANNIYVSLGIDTYININKVTQSILSMYDNMSSILNGAKQIKNELEFVIRDDLKGIENAELKEDTLIQGVVDMYVVTKDNEHIIIDFKTDKVEKKEELIERYIVQLNVYKKALEIAYNVKIDNTYIYSFSLNESIEVTK